MTSWLARGSAHVGRWAGSLAERPRRAGFSLVLLALILRLPTVGSRPMWYDEAFSVLFSSKGLPRMLQGSVDAEVHPLLYYSLLSGWMRAMGDTPIAVRGLSILFGLGSVVLGYAIGLRLMSPRQALAGGALIACLPFQVHYAQEARMYSLLACLLLGATLAYLTGVQRKGWLPWFAFALLACGAMYAHYLAAFYLIPLSLTSLFLRNRRVLLATAGSALLAVLLFLPWVGLLAGQWARLFQGYWIRVPGLEELVRTLLVFGVGLPVPDQFLPVALFLVILVLCIALLQTVGAARRQPVGWLRGLWLLGMAGAPVMLLFLVSQWVPAYLERALLPSGAMFALWLGWALVFPGGSPRLQSTAWIALVGLIAIGLWGFYTYDGFPYAPFDEINRQVAGEREAEEVIVHANKLTALPAAYQDPTIPARFLADRPGSGSETLAPATQRVLGLTADADVEQAVKGASGVWLVLFRQEMDEYRLLGIDPHPAIEALLAAYELVGETAHGDVIVQHYRLRSGQSG